MNTIAKTCLTLAAVLALSAPSLSATADSAMIEEYGNVNLVIYRPAQNAKYSYLDYRLTLNGNNLGKLKNNRVQALNLEPGRYTLMANDRNRSNVEFEIREGRTTVIRAAVGKEWSMSLSSASPEKAMAESSRVAAYLPMKKEQRYSLKR